VGQDGRPAPGRAVQERLQAGGVAIVPASARLDLDGHAVVPGLDDEIYLVPPLHVPEAQPGGGPAGLQESREILGGVRFEQSASSLEDFFRSLGQEIEISPATPAVLTRVAQLTQKTNQFNLTPRHYSEQQIAGLAKNPSWGVYGVRVKDRLGDNGLVGVVIIHETEEIAEIDTFLLSCRVVGRTVETAILSFLIDQARRRRRTKLQGWFSPTKKNDLAKEFYAQHKFQVVEENGRGTLWSLDLDKNEIICPEWIQLTANAKTIAL
jgi:hypothetical protein